MRICSLANTGGNLRCSGRKLQVFLEGLLLDGIVWLTFACGALELF